MLYTVLFPAFQALVVACQCELEQGIPGDDRDARAQLKEADVLSARRVNGARRGGRVLVRRGGPVLRQLHMWQAMAARALAKSMATFRCSSVVSLPWLGIPRIRGGGPDPPGSRKSQKFGGVWGSNVSLHEGQWAPDTPKFDPIYPIFTPQIVIGALVQGYGPLEGPIWPFRFKSQGYGPQGYGPMGP